MLHDVTRHDIIAGHQACIIDLWGLEFCIWLRPRTVLVMRARYEIMNLLRSRPSAARFAKIIYLFIFLIETETKDELLRDSGAASGAILCCKLIVDGKYSRGIYTLF